MRKQMIRRHADHELSHHGVPSRRASHDVKRVGAVNDDAEREADRVAEQILTGLGVAARQDARPPRDVAMAGGGALEPDPARRLRAERAGRRLDASLHGRLQPMVTDSDLSDVRVHTGPHADAVARSIDARAFTSGTDIYFRRGEYAPHTASGMRTLAHEIGHVTQGGAGIHRLVGAAEPARYRAGEVGSSAEEAMLSGWADVANAIHKVVLMVDDPDTDYGDQPSFGDVDAVSHISDGAGILMSAADTLAGGMEGVAGIRNVYKGHRFGDSLSKNLGATQLESGVTGVLGGGSDTGAGIALKTADLIGGEIPGLDVAMNLKSAALETKAATEDAIASGRLRGQKVRAKRETDLRMPLKFRRDRYQEFLKHVVEKEKLDAAAKAGVAKQQGANQPAAGAAPSGGSATTPAKSLGGKITGKIATGVTAVKGKAVELGDKAANEAHATWYGFHNFKSGETKRFVQLATAFNAETGKDARTDQDDFLKWMQQKGHKDFGYGSEHRKAFEREYKQDRGTGALGNRYSDFDESTFKESRDLRKVAAFGRRRKGETATLSSISAAGSTLDAVGTFTAEADFGATKATGETLKGGVQSYKGVKTVIKRGHRVHKLRKAKNTLEYGKKSDRGVLWGAKTFVAGNIEGSQQRVLAEMKAQKGGGPAKKKSVKQLSPAETAMVKKLLKTQLRRRFDDLLQCLGSKDASVQHRAKKIVHVIAETNLAGSLSKVNDNDLDKLGALHAKGTTRSPDEEKTYKRMKGALLGIFQKQLAGVGG